MLDVFGGIDSSRLLEDLPCQLLDGAVGVPGRVRPHLRAIDRHEPRPDHPRTLAQAQHLSEQTRQRRLMVRAEPGDGRVVGRWFAASTRNATSSTQRRWMRQLDRSPMQYAYTSNATINAGS